MKYLLKDNKIYGFNIFNNNFQLNKNGFIKFRKIYNYNLIKILFKINIKILKIKKIHYFII